MIDNDFAMSRRSFLDQVLVASSGIAMSAAAPWAALAATGPAKGPRVRIGVIGTGDRGRALIQNIAKTRNCVVAALCDTFAPHLAKASALVPAGTPVEILE